jgi:hypothetical protein
MSAADLIEQADVLRFESLVILASAKAMLAGTFQADEYDRLFLATEKVLVALDVAGVMDIAGGHHE